VSEPRKHHYVPVFYQKHFVNHHGLLWVYDRSLGTCKELHPASVCCEKDFYTVRPKDAPWDRRVETEIFSLVDGAGSAALRAFLSQSASRETVGNVVYFMAVHMHRTPTFARTMYVLRSSRVGFCAQMRPKRETAQREYSLSRCFETRKWLRGSDLN
jgi:Protein of unknown function (DUF4238)